MFRINLHKLYAVVSALTASFLLVSAHTIRIPLVEQNSVHVHFFFMFIIVILIAGYSASVYNEPLAFGNL